MTAIRTLIVINVYSPYQMPVYLCLLIYKSRKPVQFLNVSKKRPNKVASNGGASSQRHLSLGTQETKFLIRFREAKGN